MGRREYSDEERAQMVDIFLRATRKIIDSEGITSVSIRKVATAAGYHSSTLYLYFRNLDELVTFACMGYLVGYCRKMADAASQMKTPRDVYYRTWEIFCNSAFENPQIFQQLFFSEHVLPLDEMVKRYYKVYPHQLDSMDSSVTEMLTAGELDERNIHVLRPLAAELGYDEEETLMVNTMTTCFFKRLLSESCRAAASGEGPNAAELTAEMIEGINFLFRNATATRDMRRAAKQKKDAGE
ncbi:TetR/AcrR family transcriptional regulator [Enorma phocaeensis]|uniref:TetR/AcrR family transcriptional regulator n=1 Tax=Enorma phocaeensis TaxID=1871019 RepID=UPI0015E1543A|nr:TetR/AcrR family transcriptional regulator [Enorma phocaeensis]